MIKRLLLGVRALVAIMLAYVSSPGPAAAQTARLEIAVAKMRALDAAEEIAARLETEIRAQLPQAAVAKQPAPLELRDVLTLVRTGRIGIAIVPLVESGAGFAEAATQPWLYGDAAAANRALHSEAGALAAAQLEQTGVYALALTTIGFSPLATRSMASRQELESLSGVVNRRLIAGAPQSQSARVITQLGAQPTTLAAGEAVVAIERGVVDGAIIVADRGFQRAGYADVLKNYVADPYQPIAACPIPPRGPK